MGRQLTMREKRALETRQKIIDAARRVFLKNGFDKTTVSQIIKDAGVGYGTAYVYFKNKDDLFVTIMEDVMDKFFQVAKLEFRPTSTEEAISIINQQVRSFMNLAIEQRPMLRIMKDAIGLSKTIKAEWENIQNEFIQGIVADITFAQKNNLADPSFDPVITATSWYHMNELFMWKFAESEDLDLDRVVSQLTLFYTKALY